MNPDGFFRWRDIAWGGRISTAVRRALADERGRRRRNLVNAGKAARGGL